VRAFALALVFAAFSTIGTAAAARAPQPVPIERYGIQTVTADVIAGGVVLGGVFVLVASRDRYDPAAESVGWGHVTVGLLAYAIAPPIIHLAHRNGSGAALSLTTRVGFPLGVGFTAAAITAAFVDECPSGLTLDGDIMCNDDRLAKIGRGALVGAAIGAAFASAFDATVLAHHYVMPGPPTWTLLPAVYRGGGFGGTISAAF
jgi:hypothetical protein